VGGGVLPFRRTGLKKIKMGGNGLNESGAEWEKSCVSPFSHERDREKNCLDRERGRPDEQQQEGGSKERLADLIFTVEGGEGQRVLRSVKPRGRLHPKKEKSPSKREPDREKEIFFRKDRGEEGNRRPKSNGDRVTPNL